MCTIQLVSVKISFAYILRRKKVHISYQIQQFNCRTNISSLGFISSSQLLSLMSHKQNIMKHLPGGTSTQFHSGAVQWQFSMYTLAPSDSLTLPMARLPVWFVQAELFLSPCIQDSGRSCWCHLRRLSTCWYNALVGSPLNHESFWLLISTFKLYSTHNRLLFCLLERFSDLKTFHVRNSSFHRLRRDPLDLSPAFCSLNRTWGNS